jgi:hypothetical protein
MALPPFIQLTLAKPSRGWFLNSPQSPYLVLFNHEFVFQKEVMDVQNFSKREIVRFEKTDSQYQITLCEPAYKSITNVLCDKPNFIIYRNKRNIVISDLWFSYSTCLGFVFNVAPVFTVYYEDQQLYSKETFLQKVEETYCTYHRMND